MAIEKSTGRELEEAKEGEVIETTIEVDNVEKTPVERYKTIKKVERIHDTNSAQRQDELEKIEKLEELQKNRSNNIFGILFVLILVVVMLLGVFIGLSVYGDRSSGNGNSNNPGSAGGLADDINDNDRGRVAGVVSSSDVVLEITNPDYKNPITGLVNVEGKATASLNTIRVRLYDDNNKLIGEELVQLTASDPEIVQAWEVTLHAVNSPTSTNGLLVAAADTGDITLRDSKQVQFDSVAGENFVLYTPLINQSVNDEVLLLRGEVRNLSGSADNTTNFGEDRERFLVRLVSNRESDFEDSEQREVLFSRYIYLSRSSNGQFVTFNEILQLDRSEFPIAANSAELEIFADFINDSDQNSRIPVVQVPLLVD